MAALDKERELEELLSGFSSAIVAFSGGVDSSYLAFTAHRILGERARAVTAVSPSVSELQRRLALEFAQAYGLRHHVIQTREMEDPNYRSNPSNRCYFCKSELYDLLNRLRDEWEVEVILDGSNADDVGDWRPGRQAAAERFVRSPLIEVALGKAEIRQLSRHWGLPSGDLPAMPCLSSRFPYGVEITEEKLLQVDRAESFLRELGFRNFRVRHHEKLARIELDRAEMSGVLDLSLFDAINAHFRSLGYQHVTLDLQGFRSGSLNETLNLTSLRTE